MRSARVRPAAAGGSALRQAVERRAGLAVVGIAGAPESSTSRGPRTGGRAPRRSAPARPRRASVAGRRPAHQHAVLVVDAIDLGLAAAVAGRAVGSPVARRQLGQAIPGRGIAGLELDPALQCRAFGRGVAAQRGEPGNHRGDLGGARRGTPGGGTRRVRPRRGAPRRGPSSAGPARRPDRRAGGPRTSCSNSSASS